MYKEKLIMSNKFFKSRTFKIAFSVIIFFISIFLIVKLVDFKFFWERLKHLKIEFLLFAISSLLASYFFRVLRYEYLLNIKNKKIQLFSVSAIHYFLNKILPARSGEISFPLLLKNHLNYNYTNGISILFFARILDFFAMIFLLLISSFFIKSSVIKIQNIIFLLILMIFGLLLFVIVSNLILKSFIDKYSTENKLMGKLKTKIFNLLKFIDDYRKNKSMKFLFKIISISLLNWISIYMYYYFVVHAFNLDLSFFKTTFASSISNFTFMLPSSVGNIGPFEGAWAVGFYLIEIGKDISVPIGLFSNIFAILITAVLAGLGYVFLKHKK